MNSWYATCMDTHSNGHSTNGKPQSLIRTLATMPASAGLASQPHRFDRVLGLLKDAIDLEVTLKAKMVELEAEVSTLDRDGLSGIFASMFRVPPREEKGPGLAKANPPTTWVDENTLKGRIITLMGDGRERKSSIIIKSLKAKNVKSSVYHALKELVNEGFLMKPAYGFYRKA